MPPGIVRNQSYLIINGRRCGPGHYNVSVGDTVEYVMTVVNKISPETVRARVVDVRNDRAIYDNYIHMGVDEKRYIRGAFTVSGEMWIEMQVWVEVSPGYWRIYDEYG